MITGISIAFGFLLLYYCYFLYSVYRGLNNVTVCKTVKTENGKFVSVIIPFRNEEKIIVENLKSIEKQNYDDNLYEVIYVDDNSTDNSVEVLKKNIVKKNVKILKHENGLYTRAHKKKAIEHAIGKSKGEIIVTTDADCTHGADWLSSLVGCFDDDTGFVSGPVEFVSNGKLFEDLQALEFAGLIITGAGLIGAGKPAICNAANLAFLKEVFFQAGGYSGNLNLSSGDDEFLMQKIHADTKYKVKFCADKKAKAYTKPNEDFRSFYHQRKRWASKGLFYKNKKLVAALVLIFLFYFSILLFPFLAVFINPVFWSLFVIGIVFKLITEYLVLKKGIAILYDKKILRKFLIAEVFHVPYIVFASLLGLWGNYKWKDRKIER